MRNSVIIILFIFASCESSYKNRLERGNDFFDKQEYESAIYEFSQIPESSDSYQEAQALKSRAEILKEEKIEFSKLRNDSIQTLRSQTKENIPEQSTKPSLPYSSKYSSQAVKTSNDRVERWISLGYLKFESNYKVYISPDLWNSVDISGKEEVALTLLIYTEVFEGRGENSSIEFLDKQSGKEIASWSIWSGFEIK
ncbi:hypothetical protein SAMN03080617_00001 [Algoriphagus alkaliphilus]|uniref:Uncharacterized protein n=1 Tax=Algoriphagus alkaliphilus TaxID=279824 RepID=A0A1G5UVN0_9BACT|nr:hypothetical protein [Algoriphagus alkaliphilus]SDA37107.1 hypothetical protein SAMN03080617_00001 [Algoriphagus alkaliphilus]